MTNAAERAIRTFKNHFTAGLCSTDKQFPINCWDLLLPQATMTLNLLQNSRVFPKLSAYTVLEGQHDFNHTPLAPPGTRVIIHEKPTQRGTWAPHGKSAFYVGPAMEHYRCFKCYVPSTRTCRVSDTVIFMEDKFKIPQMTAPEATKRAATNLI